MGRVHDEIRGGFAMRSGVEWAGFMMRSEVVRTGFAMRSEVEKAELVNEAILHRSMNRKTVQAQVYGCWY